MSIMAMAAASDALDGRSQRHEIVRPRRLEADTLSYLKEVTEMLTQSGHDDTTSDDTELMLWNVLEELAPRAASAASDRHAGELLEVFLPKMNDAQLRFLLHKMAGYMNHLWTNRYSSHVLQNLLARVSDAVAKEVDGMANEDNEDDRMKDIPLLSDVIVRMVKEVKEEWLTLMSDVSASHVLRSVLAVLAGKPLVPEKRGKKAKHRVITFAEARCENVAPGSTTYAIPDTFDALFQELLATLIESSTHELQNLLYDQNAGPLIASALKLAPSKSHRKLAEKILQWDDKDACEGNFYDLAADAVTSHLLEAMFESASDKFFTKLFKRCVHGNMVQLGEHNVANYVVQQVIKLVRTEAIATEVLEELKTSFWTLLTMGRPGVIWRVMEMCVRFGLGQQEVFVALLSAVAKLESKKPEAVRKNFVASLLNVQLSTSATSAKVQLNVMGAKIIEQLQQFEAGDYLSPLYRGILSFNNVQLMALAKDSIGSRCVVEPIWESKEPSTAWVRQELYERFVGKFGTLAMDRLGAFSVMKCYEDLSLDQKESVVRELLAVETQLSGSHFSQLVMNVCHLFEYKQSRDKWKALYTKQQKIVEMFKDFVEEDETRKATKKQRKEKKPAKRKVAQLIGKETEQRTEGVAKSADVVVIMDALRSGAAGKDKKMKKSKKHRTEKM